MFYVLRTHLMVQEATNPSFHTTTAQPRLGFSQPVLSDEIFLIFSLFFHFSSPSRSLRLAAEPSGVKQYWPHTATAKAKALKSVLQRFAREKTTTTPSLHLPLAGLCFIQCCALTHHFCCACKQELAGAVTPPQKSQRHVAEQIPDGRERTQSAANQKRCKLFTAQ